MTKSIASPRIVMEKGLGSGQLGGSGMLSSVTRHDYYQLAGAGGLAALSIGMLAQSDTTLGKVTFGLTTAVFGFAVLAKLFEVT